MSLLWEEAKGRLGLGPPPPAGTMDRAYYDMGAAGNIKPSPPPAPKPTSFSPPPPSSTGTESKNATASIATGGSPPSYDPDISSEDLLRGGDKATGIKKFFAAVVVAAVIGGALLIIGNSNKSGSGGSPADFNQPQNSSSDNPPSSMNAGNSSAPVPTPDTNGPAKDDSPDNVQGVQSAPAISTEQPAAPDTSAQVPPAVVETTLDEFGCASPVAPEAIDGNSATEEEMIAATTKMKLFVSSAEKYQTCLDKYGAEHWSKKGDAYSAADKSHEEEKQLAKAFGDAVDVYKARIATAAN